MRYGFEKPTPEEMDAWHKWFAAVAGRQVDRGGLRGGCELTSAGARDLPFGKDSLTGSTVIEAESLKEAEEIARGCPIVASTAIYEIHK